MARTDLALVRGMHRAVVAGCLAACLTALAACVGADDATPATTTPAAPGIGTLPAAVATTRPGPLGTEEPPATVAQPPATGSGDVQSGPVQIDVTVGMNSGPTRIELVAVGSEITLNITNPAAADEFHVHGIDLDRSVEAGVMATFNFVVAAAGTYEVESHVTGEVLVVVEAV